MWYIHGTLDVRDMLSDVPGVLFHWTHWFSILNYREPISHNWIWSNWKEYWSLEYLYGRSQTKEEGMRFKISTSGRHDQNNLIPRKIAMLRVTIEVRISKYHRFCKTSLERVKYNSKLRCLGIVLIRQFIEMLQFSFMVQFESNLVIIIYWISNQ